MKNRYDIQSNTATTVAITPADSPKGAALEYADRGWFVFPCWEGSKRPAIRWGERATKDVELVERWWNERPRANIGISCGPSKLIVIDLDRKNGVDGWKALDRCLAELGELPGPVPIASTPTGGAHLYFAAPDGPSVKNSAGKLGEGIDVRGLGGFVVAPPSEVNGRRYCFDVAGEPCPLPNPWAEAMRDRPSEAPMTIPFQTSGPAVDSERLRVYCVSALEDSSKDLAATPLGQRNEALLKFACSMGSLVPSGGITEAEIAEAAQWACGQWPAQERDRCKDGLTLRRGVRWGSEHPRELRLL